MPQKTCSFTRRKRSHSEPARLSHRRPKKCKEWHEDSMKAAIQAVEDGQSVFKAARDHGVPKTTPYHGISGRVRHGVNPGPRPYLSNEEEKKLGSYLKQCSKIKKQDVAAVVQNAASDKGVLRTSRWWHSFLKRNQDLSLQQGDATGHVRMEAMNSETMQHYFALLKKMLEAHDLVGQRAQMYNVDESGMPFNPCPPKVVSPKGRQTKEVRYCCSGQKGQITVVTCANAAGQALPPMVIFSASRLNPAWTKGEVPGTQYGLNQNGWIITKLFESQFIEYFITNAHSTIGTVICVFKPSYFFPIPQVQNCYSMVYTSAFLMLISVDNSRCI